MIEKESAMAKESGSVNLTPLGKIISVVLILGLIGLGAYILMDQFGFGTSPKEPTQVAQSGTASQVAPASGPTPTGEAPADTPEEKSSQGITTVTEYKYVPADKLPPVSGASAYKWDPEKKILRFSYNVWAGWLPIIAANRGTEPNDESIFYKKYGFRVQMVLMDDPVTARDAYVAGDVHTLWGTVDMITLFAGGLTRDSRTAPRIVQQIDWSNGGDGIVVRDTIKTISQLKGKTIAFAPNAPSEYYLMSLLMTAGISPRDIVAKNTDTAFGAAAAFVADKKIDACVSWAPDIYNIPDKVKGAKILSSTADANKLIADVYAVRADFMRDHPNVVKGLVAGIFEGMDMIAKDPEPAYEWMAKAFNFPVEEIRDMAGDFHTTNFAENAQFFLNSSNPTNFERTWKNACYVYGELGRLDNLVPFDKVSDFSIIQQLEKEGTFKHQKDMSIVTFTPGTMLKRAGAGAEAIITQTIRINFYPNSSNPYEPARDEYGVVKQSGQLYDMNVDKTLERVAQLSGQFARSMILIEGHTDSSMKGRIPESSVKALSLSRATAIKDALIGKYKFPADKFIVEGVGWAKPADAASPMNQAVNRRVEISVFPPESQ